MFYLAEQEHSQSKEFKLFKWNKIKLNKEDVLKEIEKQTSIHSYGFCPLSSVKTVLLLAESDEDEKNQELHAFKEQLKAEGKTIIFRINSS